MRVAIFENEFEELRRAFNGFNLIFYNKTLQFDIFPTAQSIGSLTNLENYDYVLVDIDLSPSSQLDGLQLLQDIMNLNNLQKIKPIILTGQPTIKEKLKNKKLPLFPIISKPLIYDQIDSAFKDAKSVQDYKTVA